MEDNVSMLLHRIPCLEHAIAPFHPQMGHQRKPVQQNAEELAPPLYLFDRMSSQCVAELFYIRWTLNDAGSVTVTRSIVFPPPAYLMSF